MSKSIEMINKLGFEDFTFKKLGIEIGSNERSVYRYFESKHALLVYLINCYWSWIDYKLVSANLNVNSSLEKLEKAIEILTEEVNEDNSFSYFNEVILTKIIISESSKAYHTKALDKENKKRYYKIYKDIVKRVSSILLEINPYYEFPHILISTVIEGAHHQRYFSKHLHSLTDDQKGSNNIERFYTDVVFKTTAN